MFQFKYSFVPLLISLFISKVFTYSCPDISLQSEPQVNITEYIKSSWYIQQQQVNGYQTTDDLYCVVATYNIDSNSHVPFFNKKTISVYNYGNYQKINGKSMGTNMILCAREYNESSPEKLSVAPCFLPNLFAGPYWIIMVGPYTDRYEWAVVSGGQPSVKVTNTTCTTKETGVNGAGLWIFSRNPVMNTTLLQTIRSELVKKGVAVSKLIDVPQQGCLYNNSYIKL